MSAAQAVIDRRRSGIVKSRRVVRIERRYRRLGQTCIQIKSRSDVGSWFGQQIGSGDLNICRRRRHDHSGCIRQETRQFITLVIDDKAVLVQLELTVAGIGNRPVVVHAERSRCR